MAKLIIHQSGRQSITTLANTAIKITDKNGKEDKVVEVRQIHGVEDKELQKMMEKPQEFDKNKYAKDVIEKEK